ncbi:YxiF family protein [Bacillus sp. FSL K6-2839]|uniref:YxiF family protein n=1 Tax=Bacillus sp. FSL K6-2839 TaxID=2921480 RepID=UPI0030FBBBC3
MITKNRNLKKKKQKKTLNERIKLYDTSRKSIFSIEENQLYCQKVFTFLQSREDKIQIHGNHYREHIEKSTHMLKEMVSQVKVTPTQGRLIFFREHEIEAVLLNLNEVFSHLNQLLEQTKFLSGYGDFILVAEDFRFGLCIERTEYYYEFSTWGLIS